MKIIFFLFAFLFQWLVPLKAQTPQLSDDEFMSTLDSVKSPFEDGIPKPVVIETKIVEPKVEKKVIKAKPVPVKIVLPDLKLQGVFVGDEMHQAIIDDTVVPLKGKIKGVELESVTKQGVGLLYKGKKFFLKVE